MNAELRLLEKDGEKILPVFTSEKSLSMYFDGPARYTALKSKTVFWIAMNGGVDRVYVNPFTTSQKQAYFFGTLNRTEMRALAEGLIPDPVPGGSPVPKGAKTFMGRPAKPYPVEWANAFSTRLKDFPRVKKAILYQVSYDTEIYEQKKPHPCMRILIEQNANPQEIVNELGRLFKEISGGEGWINFSFTGDDNSFSEISKHIEPFYARK